LLKVGKLPLSQFFTETRQRVEIRNRHFEEGNELSENKSVLLIRADANSKIGTGHLMRCMALAQAWKRQSQNIGTSVVFALGEVSEDYVHRINSLGFETVRVGESSKEVEIQRLDSLLASLAPEWLVLDGYRFDRDFQKALDLKDTKLMVIDDFGHAGLGADVVLNQNISATEIYRSDPPESKLLLGTRYSLLRSEFLNFDTECFDQPKRVQRILLTMGGSDPENATEHVLNSLGKFAGRDVLVDLVIGPCNMNSKRLREKTYQYPFKIRFHHNVSNMITLMCAADLAISAGGTTCYELARVGVPMLLVAIADNQVAVAKKMHAQGCAVYAGSLYSSSVSNIDEYELAEAIKNVCKSIDLRRDLAVNCRNLVDGRGAERVVSTLQGFTMPPGMSSNSFGVA